MISNKYLNKIIQCHVDSGDPETFIIGRICWVSDSWFIVQEVSIYGQWDGISLYPQSDVIKVTECSEYLNKMNYVLGKRSEQPMLLPAITASPLSTLLQYAKDNSKICSFELNKNGNLDPIGLVKAFDDECVQIFQYTEDGDPDGETLILQSSISRIHIGERFLQYLEILINH